MSSFVGPLSGGPPPQPPSRVTSPPIQSAQSTQQTRPTEGAWVSVDTMPGSPPQEVLTAMGAASRAYQDLRSQHKDLQFVKDAHTGRIVAEVRDDSGKIVAVIPPTKVLDVASGSPL